MNTDHTPTAANLIHRIPWNKGKIVVAKPPLRPSHVWSIRTKLQMEGRKRDLALFNLAIDKTGRPVRFELTDQTRLAIDDYLRATGRKSGLCAKSWRVRPIAVGPPSIQCGTTPASREGATEAT
jgi:hypothetical protein